MDIKHVSVLGAGLMGHGIAQVFAQKGFNVSVFDVDREILKTVRSRVRKNFNVFIELGLIDEIAVEECIGRIDICFNIDDAVQPADVVIEAVKEDGFVKKNLFKTIEPYLSERAVVCTNTSAISITDLSQGLSYRERFLGTHFWNPPHIIPCVEVVMGRYTSEATFETICSLMAKVGKEPVRVMKDVPGFLGNRLQHAMWREAISLVEKGVANPEEVDKVVKYGFGLRLPFIGPLETADLAGLDLTRDIHEYLFPHLENSTMVSPELENRVSSGFLGVKTGQGFHLWTEEKTESVVKQRDRFLLLLIKQIEDLTKKRGF